MRESNHVLEYIRALETFGVGAFTSAQVAEKCALVRRLMYARPVASRPRISVVVPAQREERSLLATLRSLAEQTHPSFEVLVVSNGEPAGNRTQAIAEACGARVLYDPTPGIARARQTGLEAARGAIVVSTDADTLHPRGWLATIEGVLRDERIRCGAGLLRALSPRRSVRVAQQFISWTMRAKNALHPRLVTGVSEANSFFRREAALAVGGYDLDVRVGEGIRLFRKFHRAGVPLVFPSDDLVVYTSARRIERQGALRWLATVMGNTALQLVGGKGIDETAYPDVR
ncbi:MAG: glycosyltransferase [Thermoanaerobaculia bacterium]